MSSQIVPHKAIDSLQSALQNEVQAINDIMLHSISDDNHSELLLNNVYEYIVKAGGKRIRPLLTLAISKVTSQTEQINDKHIALAAAVELIHTATLLHDDVIDSTFTRRNLPTANSVWNDKTSILVGDNMFSKAFQLMVGTGSIPALKMLADASAAISSAEVLQLQLLNNIDINIESYIQLITGKTARLFAASCTVGTLVNGCEKATVDAAMQFGLNLGICYQISDDMLDYVGTPEVLGKAAFQDIYEGKVTIPLILLLQRLREEDSQNNIGYISGLLGQEKITEDDQNKLLAMIERYDIERDIQRFASQYLDKTNLCLSKLHSTSNLIPILTSLANEITNREK